MQEKNSRVWQPFIYGAVLAIGILGGYFLKNNHTSGFKLSGNDKLDQVISRISSDYVDTINSEELTEAAIVEMLHQLDPHSSYIPADELKSVNEQLEGNFEGIGVEFNLLDDTIFVASVLPDGPSEKAGLQPGDRIITVDGETVAGIKIDNGGVAKRLKGEKGTKVKVGIKRMGEKELIDFTITRGQIPLYSVEATYMLNPTTGYIKLVSFSRDTYQELIDGISQLKTSGMKSLILDLRGNPGGYLHAATGVASEFLGNNKLMVYTEGRKDGKKEYKTDSKGGFMDGKLVVLIDEGSASASEIVSGAVQDWDRGVIVGRRSYGKGLVQESYGLNDGSALRLTIARYYTPTGRCIQKPYDDGYDSYESDILDRFNAGEFDSQDSLKTNRELEYTTPKGRKVYGGGGIYPDIFVPIDSSLHSDLLTDIYRYGFISRVAYKYGSSNREELLKKYKSIDAFVAGFNFNNVLDQQIKELLRKSEITFTNEQLAKLMPTIKRQANAYVARQLYGRQAYQQALNTGDNTVDAALNALNNYEALLQGNGGTTAQKVK